MTKNAKLSIRITETLRNKVEKTAQEQGISISELMADLIERLPTPKD